MEISQDIQFLVLVIWLIGTFISFGMSMEKHKHCNHTLLFTMSVLCGHVVFWTVFIGQEMFRRGGGMPQGMAISMEPMDEENMKKIFDKIRKREHGEKKDDS